MNERRATKLSRCSSFLLRINPPRTSAENRGDLDADDDIDLADLAQLLGHYGLTGGVYYTDGDLDRDGDVDLADLAALLAVYGTTCE